MFLILMLARVSKLLSHILYHKALHLALEVVLPEVFEASIFESNSIYMMVKKPCSALKDTRVKVTIIYSFSCLKSVSYLVYGMNITQKSIKRSNH